MLVQFYNNHSRLKKYHIFWDGCFVHALYHCSLVFVVVFFPFAVQVKTPHHSHRLLERLQVFQVTLGLCEFIVDCPTQLICTWIFICCVPWQNYKTKRTQQGNLLAKNRNKTGLKWKRFNVDKTMKSAVRWDMVSANTASSEPQCYKKSYGSQDARIAVQPVFCIL